MYFVRLILLYPLKYPFFVQYFCAFGFPFISQDYHNISELILQGYHNSLIPKYC